MPVKITVVTPSYNQAKYLDETLRSVLSQRDQIDELFVLDGGSTDGSVDIIRKYADKGGIDYWHSEKDRGQSDAIHQGFKRATGDYMAWLNSDDIFLPGALKRVRQTLERHPDWDALTGYHVRVDSDSRILSQHRIPGESSLMAWWGVHHVCQQTCFFRRSVYERLGGLRLDLHTSMDTELWLRMYASKAKWGHISDYLAAFRVHQEGKGSSWVKEYADEKALVHGQYPVYLESSRQIFGMAYYRLSQMLTGRHLWASLETKRNRGRKVTDVFGDWASVPA